jgi:hypothetical protein
MASRAEQRVGRSLRAILADLPNGASILESEQIQDVLDGLEYFLPEVLQEIYREWKHESLDGFLPVVARKTREGEAEFFGLCIIISDQTLTPFHLWLQGALSTDAVSWLECRLGERGENGMVRTPYKNKERKLNALEGKAGLIEWVYKVTFGQRRS